MFVFGSKGFILSVTELLLNQVINIFVVAYMGPAALAIYARPRALLRHVRMLVVKFTSVIGPTASSLHALEEKDELRLLFVKVTRYVAYMVLPMILILSILGGPILEVWMGAHYRVGTVLLILALGHLASIFQMSVLSVLWGMNAHGRIVVANLVGGVAVIGMINLLLGPCDLGLRGAALAIAVPLVLVNGVYVPLYACRRLSLGIGQYVRETMAAPLALAVPFAAFLVAVRMQFPRSPHLAVIVGAGFGGAMLAVAYWFVVVPSHIRNKIRRVWARTLLGKNRKGISDPEVG